MVSVIIPNYNHANYLSERIESILNQTYQDFEIIILDDTSSDNSHEIIERYRQHPKVVNITLNKQNSGSTFRQWQSGFKLAKGEYIWIAESDDVALPTLLEKCVKELDASPETTLAFTEFHYIDSDSKKLKQQGRTLRNGGQGVIKYNGNRFISRHLLLSNSVCNASMAVFRKSAIPTNTLYTNFKYIGDQAFWILVAQQGDVVRIHEPLNLFRKHDNNTTKKGAKGEAYFESLTMVEALFDTLNVPKLCKYAALGKYLLRINQCSKRHKENKPKAKTILSEYASQYKKYVFCYKIIKYIYPYQRYI